MKAKKVGLSQNQTLGKIFIIPLVAFLLIFMIYPVIYNVFLSFTDARLLKKDFNFVGLKNYKNIFSNPKFYQYAKNTLIWTITSVIGQLVIGLGVALLINKKYAGTGLRSFLLIPYVVPAVVIALVTKWITNGDYGIISCGLQNLGLLQHCQSPLAVPGSSMAILVIVNIWRSFPFPMLIYWATLKGINKEMYEAASVDGANAVQSFFRITVPHLKDTTIVLVVLRIVWTATYFDLPWLITGGGPAGTTTHLPIMIYQASFGTFQTGLASSISVVLGFCLFIFIVFYVRKSLSDEG